MLSVNQELVHFPPDEIDAAPPAGVDNVPDLPTPPARPLVRRHRPRAAGVVAFAISLLFHAALFAALFLAVPASRPRVDLASGAGGAQAIRASEADAPVIDDPTRNDEPMPAVSPGELPQVVVEVPAPPPAALPEPVTAETSPIDPAHSTQSGAVAIALGPARDIAPAPPLSSRRPPFSEGTAPASEDAATAATASNVPPAPAGSPDTYTAGKAPSPAAPAVHPAGPAAVDISRLSARPGNRPPAYPPQAERSNLEGTVRLMLTVETDGRVSAIAITKSSGHSILDRAARDALARWRFDPTSIPNAVNVEQLIDFRPTAR